MKLGQSPDQTPAPEFAQWLVGSIDPPHWAHQVVADHHQVLGSSPDEPATADTPPNPTPPESTPSAHATNRAVHARLGRQHQAHPGFARHVSTHPTDSLVRTLVSTDCPVGPRYHVHYSPEARDYAQPVRLPGMHRYLSRLPTPNNLQVVFCDQARLHETYCSSISNTAFSPSLPFVAGEARLVITAPIPGKYYDLC